WVSDDDTMKSGFVNQSLLGLLTAMKKNVKKSFELTMVDIVDQLSSPHPPPDTASTLWLTCGSRTTLG
ncbi:hypothetical protein STEG23_033318, partial [Scotinomys teguina]